MRHVLDDAHNVIIECDDAEIQAALNELNLLNLRTSILKDPKGQE